MNRPSAALLMLPASTAATNDSTQREFTAIGGLTAGADGRTLGADGQWIAGLWHAGDVGQPLCPGVMAACPAGATGALAVRDMAAAPARAIAGAVANEVEPVGEPGVSVARDGIGAGA